MKFRVFWDVLLCSQIDVDQRFRGACCLHQGDESPISTVLISTLKMTTEMFLEMLVFSPLIQLTRLVAREYFIIFIILYY
jgi:hypothetical protein